MQLHISTVLVLCYELELLKVPTVIAYFSNWLCKCVSIVSFSLCLKLVIDWLLISIGVPPCHTVFPQTWTGDPPHKPWRTWPRCSIPFVFLEWKTMWKTSGEWSVTEAFCLRWQSVIYLFILMTCHEKHRILFFVLVGLGQFISEQSWGS